VEKAVLTEGKGKGERENPKKRERGAGKQERVVETRERVSLASAEKVRRVASRSRVSVPLDVGLGGARVALPSVEDFFGRGADTTRAANHPAKEPHTPTKEACTSTKEPCISAKKTHTSSKETHTSTKEPRTSAKEPRVSAKKPHTSVKEPVVSTKEPFRNNDKRRVENKKGGEGGGGGLALGSRVRIEWPLDNGTTRPFSATIQVCALQHTLCNTHTLQRASNKWNYAPLFCQ